MEKLKALQRLEESLAKLPSVGKKSAERMAFAMLEMEDDDLEEFANAIKDLKQSIHFCPICGNLTEGEKCSVCEDEERDRSTIMVVASPKDIIAFESSQGYKGLYHVLGGTISISRGINTERLNIGGLLKRVEEGGVKEIIIATNPTVDGETTALYLSKLLEKYDVNVTRLAYGLPMGGSLDYADALTLAKAVEGRRKI
ncbi:MAG: recombination mediator RecR [Bacilli bacterium]|nr:recombination mediator RecR [Bacilli bacterium]